MARKPLVMALICPCSVEFQLCLETLELGRPRRVAGRLVASRNIGETKVMAVEAGPGKTLTASATQLILDRYRPDLVVDVGSAGSLSDAIRIGDIVLATWSCEYDLCPPRNLAVCAQDLTTTTVLNDPEGRASGCLQRYAARMEEDGLRVVVGGIASGERMVNDSDTRRWLRESLDALACSWETSAVLRTAQLSGVPGLSIRVISDNADEECSQDFERYWKSSLEGLFPVLKELALQGWLGEMIGRGKAQ